MIRRVSLVVIPIDDFINKIIKDKTININLLGLNIQQIKKENGFFIFMDIKQNNIEMVINAYSYNTIKLNIDISKLNVLNPVVKVRLKPNDKYNFLNNTTCIRGKSEPNSKISIIQKCSNNMFRLFNDNKKDSQRLKIYNPLNIDLEGRSFIITEKNNEFREEFNVVEFDDANEEYILDRNLSKNYKKEICKIFKIDYIDVFEDGYFFLPLNNITKEQNKIIIEKLDGKKQIIELVEGIINDVKI